jgi:NTP pyrophosphatase (non-canonical NTP hydrolase)
MDILEKAIKHYGPENQMMISMEENSELIQAISKCLRYKDNIEARNNLVEEVADVLIMIDQLKIIMDIKDYELECYRRYKLERLERRIENEKKSN